MSFMCITGEDLDSWKENTVYVNWKVTDDESGLDYCEWAIGKQLNTANVIYCTKCLYDFLDEEAQNLYI